VDEGMVLAAANRRIEAAERKECIMMIVRPARG
jgi:hypothetical protein